jgi:hypothetical protein
MSTEEAWKKRVSRTARIARIIDHLDDVDDATLAQLDYLSRQAATPHPTRRGKGSTRGTRREFLRAAAAGGVLVATTGALAVWQLNEGKVDAVESEAQALRELIDLYEEMDNSDRDTALAAGLTSLTVQVANLRTAAEQINGELAESETALVTFQSSFPSLQAALQWLEQTTITLSQRMLALENSLNALLGVAGPTTETMGSFLAWLLSQLPPEESETARQALERTGEVISTLPNLVEGLHDRILEPMRGWFDPNAEAGLDQQIVRPILDQVIAPTAELTAQIDDLATTWQIELAEPLQQALDERAAIRPQIEQHEASHDL